MAKVVPVQLEDGLVVYIEAQEDTQTETAVRSPGVESEEQGRTGRKGMGDLLPSPRLNPAQSMKMVQDTIRSYTYYCLNSFKNFSVANVDEVTLEFGINVSADAGVPYIASGKAQSNLKITVKCTYPKVEPATPSPAIATTGNGQVAPPPPPPAPMR